MKRNHLVLALTAMVSLLSCSKEIRQQEEKLNQVADNRLTITAKLEDSVTKTAINESSGAVEWLPGDAISLFYGSGIAGGSRFVSTATERAAVTNFTGTIGVITGGADIAPEDTYFWGVYPYSSDISCDGTAVTMSVSATQTAVAGTFGPGCAPSMGRSQGLTMGFYNICGGLKFSVTKSGLKKVTVRSNAGERIAGTVKVGISSAGLPEIREVVSGTDTITLEAPEGEYFEVGRYYYIMILPTRFTAGFTLTLETFTETATVEKNSVINITRSYFGRMTNVDASATYTQKTGNIPIPDSNFKTYMVSNFDDNSDGEISYAEAAAITNINVNNQNINSLKGIEYCVNLSILNCPNNNLPEIDISNNIGLYTLCCECNQLTSLDVTNNTALTYLYCDSNSLTSLDLSTNTALYDLSCNSNQLTSLDVTNNTALFSMSCSFNGLTSLDVTNNTALTALFCYSNLLSSLDVTDNTALTYLYCDTNNLTSLDVTNNTALEYIHCGGNQFMSLNLSNNTELKELFCDVNQLTNLTVTNNTKLENLQCGNNHLTSLDVSTNLALTALDCSPMNDSFGNNLLSMLFVAPGQSIPGVTSNRSTDYIPGSTQIVERRSSDPIAFADSAVKTICVTNWDTNNDGELSYTEAAAVTSIGYDFTNNTCITSFDELQYFTGLTSINDVAFMGCSALTSVSFPPGLTSIEDYAFVNCSSLTGGLAFPPLVTSIGEQAFMDCSSLNGNLVLPAGLVTIGDGAFMSCSGLTGTLTLPSGLTYLGSSAFEGCQGLTGTLTIPSGITTIGPMTFYSCMGLSGNLVIPSGVTSIGYGAFWNCHGFTGDLILPAGLTSIEKWTFYDCIGLTGNLVIPEGVTTIDELAFKACNFSSITIPSTVASIGDAAFQKRSSESVPGYSRTITINCTTPPSLVQSDNSDYPFWCTSIIVPSGAISSYLTATGWSTYSSIIQESGQ